MSRIRTCFLIVLGLALSLPALCGGNAAPALVIVAHEGDTIRTLNRTELRKFFLGIHVANGERTLIPVINATDPELYQAFLQKVMFMSQRAYERQALSLSFRTGSSRPEIVNNEKEMRAYLGRQGVISFMWSHDVDNEPNLIVIQSLTGAAP